MQLVEALHLRMIGAEIAEEVAGSSAVVTSGFGTEPRAEKSTARSKTGARGCWSGGRRARFMRRSPAGDEVLRHGTCILQVDVLWSDLHVDERGLDVCVTHQLHERAGSSRRGSCPKQRCVESDGGWRA